MPNPGREITKNEFIQLYEDGDIYEVIYVKDRVYGRSPVGKGDDPKGYEVVYAVV